MIELIEPLIWMTACWTMGIATGLGLGSAIASQRFRRLMLEECD